MKNKIISRGLLGFPLGITLGYLITIIISAIFADGYYSACVPGFIEIIGSEIGAVIVQAVLCGILGSGFAMASVIWEMENWSIAKQSGLYFAITSIIMLPIAYITNWMEHSVFGFLIYFGIFISIFVFVWLIQYFAWKIKLKKINKGFETSPDKK